MNCSQVLEEGKIINNSGSFNSNILLLKSNQIFDEDLIQQSLCALANNNYGVILCGVDKFDQNRI